MTLTDTRRCAWPVVQCLLINDRDDGTDDEVPILADGNGHDRLDVGGVFHRMRRADSEIPVVLDRNADEGGDGILQFLGQVGLLVLRLVVTRRAAAATGGISVVVREGKRAVKDRLVLGL